jgi:hypothetical protein
MFVPCAHEQLERNTRLAKRKMRANSASFRLGLESTRQPRRERFAGRDTVPRVTQCPDSTAIVQADTDTPMGIGRVVHVNLSSINLR